MKRIIIALITLCALFTTAQIKKIEATGVNPDDYNWTEYTWDTIGIVCDNTSTLTEDDIKAIATAKGFTVSEDTSNAYIIYNYYADTDCEPQYEGKHYIDYLRYVDWAGQTGWVESAKKVPTSSFPINGYSNVYIIGTTVKGEWHEVDSDITTDFDLICDDADLYLSARYMSNAIPIPEYYGHESEYDRVCVYRQNSDGSYGTIAPFDKNWAYEIVNPTYYSDLHWVTHVLGTAETVKTNLISEDLKITVNNITEGHALTVDDITISNSHLKCTSLEVEDCNYGTMDKLKYGYVSLIMLFETDLGIDPDMELTSTAGYMLKYDEDYWYGYSKYAGKITDNLNSFDPSSYMGSMHRYNDGECDVEEFSDEYGRPTAILYYADFMFLPDCDINGKDINKGGCGEYVVKKATPLKAHIDFNCFTLMGIDDDGEGNIDADSTYEGVEIYLNDETKLTYGTDYTISKGSLNIEISEDYLNKLEIGEYTLDVYLIQRTMEFMYFSIPVKILEKAAPATGDFSVAFNAAQLISGLGLAYAGYHFIRKRKENN